MREKSIIDYFELKVQLRKLKDVIVRRDAAGGMPENHSG